MVWTPVKNLEIGVDTIYSRIQTGVAGPGLFAQNGPQPGVGNTWTISDQGVWSAIFRVQRNFLL
jgi:hypothetical protein